MGRLAVVIVSWNVRHLLRACLQSLRTDLESWAGGAEVWVVDNASADGTPAMVREAFPAVRLIASPENLGFAAGNNRALHRILADVDRRPEYVWLLNPDTEVHPGATAALVAALDAHPQAGVAGPQLRYGDGSLQQGVFRFPGVGQMAFEFLPLPARLYDTRLNGRYPRSRYAGGPPFPVDHPLGAAMMVRVAAIAQVGLLDEGYWMYCEEIDWCWRMRRAGWRALCVPQARVTHHAGKSAAQVSRRSLVNLWTSRARLYARHHGPLTRLLSGALVRAGMRRRMRAADPEARPAYRRILAAWEGV